MGGSASLLQIPHDILNETETVKYLGVSKSNLDQLQLSSEALANLRGPTHAESHRTSTNIKCRADKVVKHEVPAHVKALLDKVGIKRGPSKTKGYSANTKRLVTHIFECLEGLQHLVKADQDLLSTEENADLFNETQSVVEANRESLGKLLHEMITLYTLCGDTVRVLLQASPEAAKVEDAFGRLPLHVAVDRDQPWMDALGCLIEAYPQALNRRDGGGRLPLHIAVDRQEPNVDVVKLLLRRNPQAAMARRGVGRLPLHYAIFADKPNLEVIHALLQACPESAQIADVYGRLPLHYAVDKAVLDAEVVLCLLAAFPAGAAVRDSHLKLPLTVALERDHVDLRVVQHLYRAYPHALGERGGAGNRLPLQSLVENHPSNVAAIDLIARLCTAAVTSTSAPQKRDSPVLLAIDRNLPEVARRLLILRPEFDPPRLRALHWQARKIAFLLAKKQIFRPSVLQRLAQLALGQSGKHTEPSAPAIMRSVSSGVSGRTVLMQNSALLKDIGAQIKPRRKRSSSKNSITPSASASSPGTLLSIDLTTFTAISTLEDAVEGVSLDMRLDSTSYDECSPDAHNIYHPRDSPTARASGGPGARSPRASRNINFYLRLYKTNSDAFRLAVTFL